MPSSLYTVYNLMGIDAMADHVASIKQLATFNSSTTGRSISVWKDEVVGWLRCLTFHVMEEGIVDI